MKDTDTEILLGSLVSASPLEGRAVVLSGAAGGVGRSMARVFAAAGARLAITDISAEAAEAVARELRVDDHEVVSAGFDASDWERFAAFAQDAREQFGGLHGLVNCAGVWSPVAYDRIDPVAWRETLTANLDTAMAGCLAVTPLLVDAGGGSIVNVASTAGEYGSITPASHYAAAKGGVIALTKSLAREVGPAQVRVNAISPGPVDTLAHGATPQARERLADRTLLGRLGRPDEIAAACAFLLSDWSSYITGHVLRVNGGALI